MVRFVVALLAVLVLAGCSGSSDADSERRIREAMGTATAAASEPVKSPEDLYLENVRRSVDASSVSDAALLAAGRETCAAMDRGVTPLEVALTAAEQSDTFTEGGLAILASAATMLCREHLPAVEKLAKDLDG